MDIIAGHTITIHILITTIMRIVHNIQAMFINISITIRLIVRLIAIHIGHNFFKLKLRNKSRNKILWQILLLLITAISSVNIASPTI